MTIKLFSLSGVPDDEANDIRELLENHKIVYYEIRQTSSPAIWLRTDKHEQKARELIRDYQKERESNARAAYEHSPQKSFIQRFREDKLSYIFILFVLLVVVYLLASGTRHPM